jgi:glutamine amidotransferase
MMAENAAHNRRSIDEKQTTGGARMIAIIDYDAGNIKSVEKALHYLGEETVVSRDPQVLLSADKVILPGVGSFGDAMNNLNKFGLVPVIRQIADQKTPFLGICLGLQLLFESSEETPGVEGLGLLKGRIVKIPPAEGLKIPHMGWNSLHLQNDGRLFQGIPEQTYVYFVHSYYLQAEDPQIVKATTEYGVTIHASVEKDNIFACQFHPEKSGDVGLEILKNFVSI